MSSRSKNHQVRSEPETPRIRPWHEFMPDGDISIGASLMDTIDDLINEGHIEPQLAMKILGHFDQIVQEVLADKVKARLTFKVGLDPSWHAREWHLEDFGGRDAEDCSFRVIWIPTGFVTRYGHFC
jgi:Transcription initiation factor IIA, gamma subunit, helical domain